MSENLEDIYFLRKNFVVIGLTGRTGAGCSEVAELLEGGFEKLNCPEPNKSEYHEDMTSYRKYRIVYNYTKKNFKPFKIIHYRHVFTWMVLRYPFEELIKFLKDERTKSQISDCVGELINYDDEISALENIKDKFLSFQKRTQIIDENEEKKEYTELYDTFFDEKYEKFSDEFHDLFKMKLHIKHYKLFQLISNNLRQTNHPYTINPDKKRKPENIYYVASFINHIIKSVREKMKSEGCRIVIDSLRNPLEIMYFKERYSAFYMFAVKRDEDKRNKLIGERYQGSKDAILKIEDEEHAGGSTSEFFKQDVSECIQKSDIHLEYITNEEAKILNDNKQSDAPLKVPIEKQVLKYIALIGQPGMITPTPEERCMQIAYSAKYNSGCISRQVGALITDRNFSIKAVGWNDVPYGQVACSLRNVNDYLQANINEDYDAYSEYEKSETFRNTVENYYKNVNNHEEQLDGRNVCFCFKQLQNHMKEGKNQVHTRALHAEENAFLQIVKYGGIGIIDGILFSTASPCELCSKKAVQLNINVIYYIDPYPGIATEHILKNGRKQPELRQFTGAIGKAYHKFYEPFMPYKDELALILDLDIPDFASQKKMEAENI